MGHVRLGSLPRTRKWREVVDLIVAGAEVDQVATATLTAAEKALKRSFQDVGLGQAMWLLAQLPLAAKEPNFGEALRKRGLDVPDEPLVADIHQAALDAIDKQIGNNGQRTDLGEMAQMAAAETFARVVGDNVPQLFAATPEDVRREVGKLGTEKGFGGLTRRFFARVTYRLLEFFLSREMCNHVGPSARFATLDQKRRFSGALALHCEQAAKIVEEFASGWFSKTVWEKKGIDHEAAKNFASYAMKKMTDELRAGAQQNPDATAK